MNNVVYFLRDLPLTTWSTMQYHVIIIIIISIIIIIIIITIWYWARNQNVLPCIHHWKASGMIGNVR